MRPIVVMALAAACWLVTVGSVSAAARECWDEEATIVGTSGADVLRGTAGRDVVVALGGNDRVYGLGGPDLICGGAGKDVLDGGAGNDEFDGGGGNDRILGGGGNDAGDGGDGADRMFGGPGSDVGPRGECLYGGLGDDRMFGGPGNDCLGGDEGADELVGGEGDDTLDGDVGNDVMRGGSGDDRLDGHVGTDIATGGAGRDFCRAEQRSGCEPLEVGGDLEPGTYRFHGFEPDVTLTLGEGWWTLYGLSYPGYVEVMQGSHTYSPNFNFIVSRVPEQVLDPATGEEVGLEGEGKFLDWLSGDECVDLTSGPAPATVAGVTGEQVEFTVGSDEICSGLVLWWWRYADGSGRRFFPLERDRMFVVDVEGVALLIEISTPDPDDWDAFLPEAEAVLATLEFG